MTSWTEAASSADGSELVALAGNAFMSKDFGSTWVQIFSTGIPRSIAMSADGQKLLIGTGIGVGGYLYTSTDARVWTKRF